MALRRSLSAQLLLLLLTSIGVVLAVYSFVNYRSSRDELLSFVQDATQRSSDLIRRGTRDGMLLHRLDRVQETLEDIAAHHDVAAVRVYDKDGVVVLSARREEIGHRIELDSDTCESCHGPGHVAEVGRLGRAGLVSAPDGEQVLRHLTVIENDALCAASACHPSPEDRPVLGVLDVEMSFEPVRERLEAAQWRMASTTGVLFFVVGMTVIGFVRRFVHRPVAALAAGTRSIARGELATRIDVRGRTELAALADAFNHMAADLEEARAEATEWSERLEEKVIEKTDELQRTQRQVLHMEKMASLGKLSATVAHELNNPIAAMLTYARLIQRQLEGQQLDPAVRDELNRYLETLRKECSRCGDIVRNLLAFARHTGAEMAATDINEIVERSIALIRHHLQIHGATLDLKLLEGDRRIIADEGQVQQALVALLVNSVEAMSASAEPRELKVRVTGDAGHVRIDVSDTGSGIDPTTIPHIFEPFFTTKREEAGVGLGLAVVYGIVRRHGGTIDVDSRPNVGTTFRLTLPRRPRLDGDEGGDRPVARHEPPEEAPN